MNIFNYRYVLTHHGFKELYRGIVPVLWRNGPSNALFFILREEASERLPQRVSNFKTACLKMYIICPCYKCVILLQPQCLHILHEIQK